MGCNGAYLAQRNVSIIRNLMLIDHQHLTDFCSLASPTPVLRERDLAYAKTDHNYGAANMMSSCTRNV
jgi:hypothetical protein